MSGNEANYAAELTAKVEEKYMEISDVYAVNMDNYRRLVKVYDLLKKLALLCEGGIADVMIEQKSEYAQITAEMPCFEIYPESKEIFCELLSMVDNINFSNTGNDSVLIKVNVNGIWEAVVTSE